MDTLNQDEQDTTFCSNVMDVSYIGDVKPGHYFKLATGEHAKVSFSSVDSESAIFEQTPSFVAPSKDTSRASV